MGIIRKKVKGKDKITKSSYMEPEVVDVPSVAMGNGHSDHSQITENRRVSKVGSNSTTVP